MKIRKLPTGMLASNTYIVGQDGEGIIIDPGADLNEILEVIQEEDIKIRYIILTHAHIDHICTMDKLKESTGAKTVVHEKDAQTLGNPMFNGSLLFGLTRSFGPTDMVVNEGDTLQVGDLTLQFIHTPGHTPGGMCIQINDCLFTGDTLFRMSIGRSDLGNGDQDELDASLKKLMQLDEDIKVYPGHGTSTTIGYEKRNNTFI